MEKQTIRLGNFYGFDGCSFDGTVWHRGGCSPVIRASSSHGSAPYTICKVTGFGNGKTNHHYRTNRKHGISKQR